MAYFTHKRSLSSGRKTNKRLFSKKEPVVKPIFPEPKPEIVEINRVIEAATHDLIETNEERKTESIETLSPNIVDQPAEFNGVHDEEHLQLIDAEVQNEQKKSAKLLHEIGLMKQEFDQEKQRLEQHIRDLKRELHRTAPLESHTFFSISKELKEAVGLIDKLAQPTNQPPTSTPTVTRTPTPAPPVIPPPPPVTTPIPIKADEVKKEVKKDEPSVVKKPSKKKKLLITGGAAIAVLIIGSFLTSSKIFKPKVNDALVKEYLAKNGQVAGATTAASNQPAQNDASNAQDNSQKDFTLDQTVWLDMNDPMFGVSLKYPQNVIKMVRTEGSITFLRKQGYIFRVQKTETGLDLADYWKQIKATDLNYSDKEVDFKGKKALALSLEEITKFPGDRYLVKVGKSIFDIWYATPSNSFTKDDIERAKKMLDSLMFVSIQ